MASGLAQVLRGLVPLVAHVPDARTELLALVWGPQFDRGQALQLVARTARVDAAAVEAAADGFDRLDRRGQQRLRRLLATPCATIAHAPHPAD